MNSGNEPFDGDDLVTETYRELGGEKAPEHLNASVLRMASAGGKPSAARNFLFAAWMKPVAWAATIGLSLAIVLELSELPVTPVRFDGVPNAESMPEAALEEALLIDTAASEKVENRARTESAPKRQLFSGDEVGDSSAAIDDRDVFSREPKDSVDAIAPPAASGPRPLAAKTEAQAAREMQRDLPEAKKQAAQRSADSQPMASFSLALEDSVVDDLCDDAARLSRKSWLACIETLRSAGSEEAADREYEAFVLKYPVDSSDLESNK